MNKILLIIKREYLTRVRKKSFIVMTLLGPILMGAVIGGAAYLAIANGDTTEQVKVIDETPGKIFQNKLQSDARLIFVPDEGKIEDVRKHLDHDKFYGILYIPASVLQHPDSFVLYSDKKVSLSVTGNLEEKLQREFENFSLEKAGIDPVVLKSVKDKNVAIKTKNINNNDEQANAGITAIVGFVGGLFIYMFIFVYGAQVMRGVMEEKSSRIVEVIMSSVKPFQLMMGKILGISFVALTQFLLWIVLTFIISGAVTSFIASKNKPALEKMQQMQSNPTGMQVSEEEQAKINEIQHFDIQKIIGNYNIPKIIFSFIFYFFGGYLLYASLFAAIGAAVDSETDTQQFMLPITIPLIFAYIAATVVMQNPDSSLGYWCSLIPFTSPIVMMV
jgi:ABC-2 type transport system permease protein